jgi:hypothetical protein
MATRERNFANADSTTGATGHMTACTREVQSTACVCMLSEGGRPLSEIGWGLRRSYKTVDEEFVGLIIGEWGCRSGAQNLMTVSEVRGRGSMRLLCN